MYTVHSEAKMMAPGKREAALVQIPHSAARCPRGTTDRAFRQISTLLTLIHHAHSQKFSRGDLKVHFKRFRFLTTDEVHDEAA